MNYELTRQVLAALEREAQWRARGSATIAFAGTAMISRRCSVRRSQTIDVR